MPHVSSSYDIVSAHPEITIWNIHYEVTLLKHYNNSTAIVYYILPKSQPKFNRFNMTYRNDFV